MFGILRRSLLSPWRCLRSVLVKGGSGYDRDLPGVPEENPASEYLEPGYYAAIHTGFIVTLLLGMETFVVRRRGAWSSTQILGMCIRVPFGIPMYFVVLIDGRHIREANFCETTASHKNLLKRT